MHMNIRYIFFSYDWYVNNIRYYSKKLKSEFVITSNTIINLMEDVGSKNISG